jgi:hypothetical protein
VRGGEGAWENPNREIRSTKQCQNPKFQMQKTNRGFRRLRRVNGRFLTAEYAKSAEERKEHKSISA